jgi:hypothetical protein
LLKRKGSEKEATNYIIHQGKHRNEDIKETNNGKNGRNAKDGRGNAGERNIKVTERKKEMGRGTKKKKIFEEIKRKSENKLFDRRKEDNPRK